MTIRKAEEIVEIVSSALQDTSYHHHPISALKGYDIFHICMALKLRIANDFLLLEHRHDFEELFAEALRAYDAIPWMIMASFVPDDQVDDFLATPVFNFIDPSTKTLTNTQFASLERESSFGKYCRSVGSKDSDYWRKVYARIGLDYTPDSPKGNTPVIYGRNT